MAQDGVALKEFKYRTAESAEQYSDCTYVQADRALHSLENEFMTMNGRIRMNAS